MALLKWADNAVAARENDLMAGQVRLDRLSGGLKKDSEVSQKNFKSSEAISRKKMAV